MAQARTLRLLLSTGQYELAAHRLVYGLVTAKVKENNANGKKRSAPENPGCAQAWILQQGA
ncbi:MAG: hypothetical protein J7J88_00530 [Dehalococcoidia bacterium]|nr:hypothetical protein [Dehalococcoidia bacterium]